MQFIHDLGIHPRRTADAPLVLPFMFLTREALAG